MHDNFTNQPLVEMTMSEAIRTGLREEMERDPFVFIMGEDVAAYGGVFKVTDGLIQQFGQERVRDTPISEQAITGLAIGAAMAGWRPVIEIMFCDFITLAMDQLVNHAAKFHYMTGGRAKVPLTVRTSMGAGRRAAAQHSQSLYTWFAHVPGLKVVLPSSPADAKGLIKTAIRDDNPVIFFEEKLLYKERGLVPKDEYTIPLGKAVVRRPGKDATIVALARMVPIALGAAAILEDEGFDVEVVDPRTIVPLDYETLIRSAQKTHRVIVVDEASRSFGASAEIAAGITEGAFEDLDAPVLRVAAMDVPVPYSWALEPSTIPDEQKIIQAIHSLFGR